MAATISTNDNRRLTLYETVLRITGPIQPIGDSTLDPLRLANQKELQMLVVQLIGDIQYISDTCEGSHQDSVKSAGKSAAAFLKNLTELADTTELQWETR